MRTHTHTHLRALAPQVRVPLQDLLVIQRVNHFPEAKQLTRKDLIKRHLLRCVRTSVGRSA